MPWAFLVLPLSMYSMWVIWPIIQSFALSFTDWRGIEPKVNFIGFENFTRLFGDKVFWTSLKNNLLWLILFVGIPVPIGLLVAMLFDIKLPGGKIFKTLFYLSMTLSFIVIAQIWSWIYEPQYGVLTNTFKFFGFNNLGEVQQAAFSFLIFGIIPFFAAIILAKLIDLKIKIKNHWKILFLYIGIIVVFLLIAKFIQNYWNPQLTISRTAKKGFPWISDPETVTFSLIFDTTLSISFLAISFFKIRCSSVFRTNT